MGDKRFVVVDGEEGKHYGNIKRGSTIFSPNSKYVAYVAEEGTKQFVVVDGEEGKHYDDIITTGGGRIIFDSPDSFHYLSLKDNSVYLVEEKIE